MAWRLITVQHCNTPGDQGRDFGEAPDPTFPVDIDDIPATYGLSEILALRNRSIGEAREVHRAKVAYGGQRIVQD